MLGSHQYVYVYASMYLVNKHKSTDIYAGDIGAQISANEFG
jgi:hypothetical protein